jgi:hypothetical protein
MLGIIELGRARHSHHLRHAPAVQVFGDCHVAGRAERSGNCQHFLALDEFAGLLHRLRWAVGVVERNQIDFAPVNPAFGIDHLEIGSDRP